MKPSMPRKITVPEMAPHVHTFEYGENKVKKITEWLKIWIKNALHTKKIKPYDFLPSKGDLAYHIGVSTGTMQAVFRQLEDEGLVVSKQRQGTYIKPAENFSLKKQTSKRDVIEEKLKQYILKNCKINDNLISSRKFAKIMNLSNTTVRLAILNLVNNGILKKEHNNFIVIKTDFKIDKINEETLAQKIAKDIKKYIQANVKTGEKIPANIYFAKSFKVSVKTIHDAIKLLSKEGVLYTKRGRYGTIFINNKKDIYNDLYDYEKITKQIKNYIIKNNKVGDKLPTIRELSRLYNSSEKTIKHALDDLAELGFVTFLRGRYGGTFVAEIPSSSNDAYKWLAIDSNFIPDMEN